MSKKKVTTTERTGQSQSQFERQFDTTSYDTYKQLQPQIGATLGDFMANPWESGGFQRQLARAFDTAGQLGSRQMQGVLNLANHPGFGVSGMPAFLASEAGRSMRGTPRLQSDALTNLQAGSAAGQAQG